MHLVGRLTTNLGTRASTEDAAHRRIVFVATSVRDARSPCIKRLSMSETGIKVAHMAMTAMLVHGFFDNSYFLVDLAYVFWMTLALVDDHPPPIPNPLPQPPTPNPQPPRIEPT